MAFTFAFNTLKLRSRTVVDKYVLTVEPSPSALNMTLPAVAAELRRLQSQLSIDAGAMQQTRQPLLLLSIDETDRYLTVT